MRLNKSNVLRIFALVFIIMLACNLLWHKDAQAYWKESNDKTVQCFAVEYKKEEAHNDPVSGNVGGTQVQRYISGAYSTRQICAKVDSNGKVVGNLYEKDRPKDTSSVKYYPQLEVDQKNGRQINMLFCGDGSAACGSGVAPLSYSYSVENKTFREVATSVINQAPSIYNNNSSIKKGGIDEIITKTSAAKEANEASSENYEEAVENGYGNRCKASGGAKSLGWIVCPILEWMSDAANDIYDNYVEPSLQIEPQLFNDESSSTWDAWNTFRDFANIAFVILLLFVIFSQLTGVGIDNYGIKKILPKLIVAAVLINLSYVICVLAVDVSNILGNSFQNLFKGLGDGLVFSKLDIEGETINLDGSLVTTGLTGVGLLALLGGGAFAFLSNPAILLSLLVSALGIVISIFFLFILLSMREAAVVVLVVIAPLAFVAYILPNTKKLFDKWLNFFKGLLIVYPVCGLLVGGGNYVSKLLLAANVGGGGFITAFATMIVGVLPIFFIPMVIRSAFNTLGTVGSRLAKLGDRMSGGATGALRGAGWYQNAQAASKMRQSRILGGITKTTDKDGNVVYGTAKGAGRRLTNLFAGGNKNRQRYAHQYRRMVDEQGALAAADEAGFMDPVLDKMAKEQLVASGMVNNIGMSKDGNGNVSIDEQGLTAALIRALRENDHSNIREITNALSAKGDGGRDAVKYAWNTAQRGGGVSESAANAFANNIMANHAADYKNNSRSMFDIANGVNNGSITRNEQDGYQTTDQYATANRDKLQTSSKAETMAAMDDSAFAEAFLGGANNYKNGTVSLAGLQDGDRLAVGENAYSALRNATNMKADRVAYLNEVLRQSGYTPPTQDVHIV